jgi:cytochrome c oxidase subunit II
MPPALRRQRHATPSPIRALRRRVSCAVAAVVSALAGSLFVSAPAFASVLAPESGGSPNANAIQSLYTIIFWMAVVVCIAVLGALLYAVIRYRESKGAVAEQIHGNTRLEVGWTVGAAVIVVIISAVTFIKLPDVINPPNSSANGLQLSASVTPPMPPNGQALVICVTGRQFIWRYTYGAGCNKAAWVQRLPYSYQEMVVPENTTVRLVIQSSDVIHSWWVPALGGKVDAVPGYTTYTWFKAPHTALFYGQCAQLCGRQHAFMTALVKVVTPSEYVDWINAQTRLIGASNDQVAELRQLLIQQGDLAPGGNY